MKIISFLVAATSLLLFPPLLSANNPGDTAEKIFDRNFRTMKTVVEGDFMAPPVIRLGTNDRILVNFDEICEDNSYLQYRLVHCNADWKPSALVESEYVGGFNIADIEDYAYSQNTFVHYVNYAIAIPNEDMVPLVSGNYLLQVFDRDTPEETILQTRFRVSEDAVGVGAGVSTRTDRGVNNGWQQLSVAIDGEGFELGNPYQDLKVEILQNNREETSRFLKAPLRVDGSRILYEHAPELLFPASNEYRRFETVSTLFPAMRIDSMRYEGSNYHAYVNTDVPRAERNYEYDRTQHGRYLVREYNATDSDLGADYVTVHLTLDMPEQYDADIYVDGEMTHGGYSESNRMEYDRTLGAYTLQIPLKQGAYNYQYVAKRKGSNAAASTSLIEGNHHETENEYSVYVYLRRPGERYDRLIGRTTISFN